MNFNLKRSYNNTYSMTLHVLVSVIQRLGWKRTTGSTSTSTSFVAIRILALVICIISITTTIHNYKIISYYEFEQLQVQHTGNQKPFQIQKQQHELQNNKLKLLPAVPGVMDTRTDQTSSQLLITTNTEEQNQKRSLSVMTTKSQSQHQHQHQHQQKHEDGNDRNSSGNHETDNDFSNYTSIGEQPNDLSNDNSFSLHQANDATDRSNINETTVQVPIVRVYDESNDNHTIIINTTSTNSFQHIHKIPNNIIFTYKINLLTTTFDFYNKSHELLTDEQKELLALQNNVYRIIQLHNTSTNVNNSTTKQQQPTIYFLTDNDCIESIKRVIPLIYNNSNDNTTNIMNQMIYYFTNEKEGMYKGDVCRGIALYEYGGIYIDVDLGVRMNTFNVIQNSTEFVTIKVHTQSHHKNCFFQAFIGVTQYNIVIQRYIQLFYQYYTHTISNYHTIIGKPLGVILLKRAYDEIIHEQQQQQQQQQIIQQQQQRNMLDQYDGDLETITTKTSQDQNVATTSVPVTHIQHTSEIWEEVLYNKNMLHDHNYDYIVQTVPYPKYGIRRACHFIVVIPHKNIVPFYSRIEGSRLCPSWDDIMKQRQHDINKQQHQQQKNDKQEQHHHDHTNDKEEHHHDHHEQRQHDTHDTKEYHHHDNQHQHHHDNQHRHQNTHVPVADKI